MRARGVSWQPFWDPHEDCQPEEKANAWVRKN